MFESNICGSVEREAAQTLEREAVWRERLPRLWRERLCGEMVLCAAPVWRRRMAQVTLNLVLCAVQVLHWPVHMSVCAPVFV